MDHISTTLTPENFKLGKDLLIKLRKRQITMEEFDKEIVYFALTCGYDELRPKPLPSRPMTMMHYDGLEKKEKSAIRPEFWQQQDIKNYINQKIMIIDHNISIKNWLRELKTRLEAYGDIPNIEKVTNRLMDFGDFQ